MRRKTLEEIRKSKALDLITELRERKFSLLLSLGFRKLRSEMLLTGFVCRLIVFLTGLTRAVKKSGSDGLKRRSKAYLKTRDFLKTITPVKYDCSFPHHDTGMVIGFNHPSLGEILRCIYVCMAEYKYHQNLFPVNLPWYEALMPIVDELEAIGITITPIITPSTREKMAKHADEETMKVVDELAQSFNKHYLEICEEFLKAGENVWVAPSATRQPYLFKTIDTLCGLEKIEPQTMTFLATRLMFDKIDCVFLPLGVVPPRNYRRGLNLFRVYTFNVGDELTMEDASENIRKRCEHNKGRMFEFLFLTRIAQVLIRSGGSDFVCPREDEA